MRATRTRRRITNNGGNLYQVVVTGAPCSPLPSTAALLTVLTAPTAEAGLNQTICALSPITTLHGSVGGSATAARGRPRARAHSREQHHVECDLHRLHGRYYRGQLVTLTLHAAAALGDCPTATSAMIITISPAPTVSAGPNQTVCAVSPNTQLAGSYGGAAGSAIWSGSGLFTPNPFSLNPVYTPTAAEITAGSATVP